MATAKLLAPPPPPKPDVELVLSPEEAQTLVNIRTGGIARREDRALIVRIKLALWRVGIRKSSPSFVAVEPEDED